MGGLICSGVLYENTITDEDFHVAQANRLMSAGKQFNNQILLKVTGLKLYNETNQTKYIGQVRFQSHAPRDIFVTF